MKNSIPLFATIVNVFSFNFFAQKTKVSQTDEINYKKVCADVIKRHQKVADNGHKSADIFQKLGNGYYFNIEYKKSAKWYGELFAMTSDLRPEYYYRYAQSLKAIGQNDKANEILELFVQKYQQKNNTKILIKNNHHEK
jgi:tetratricopeptide (TPR) repeat protein